MSFFGLTKYGISDYFKFYKRPDYVEPKRSKNLQEMIEAEGGKKSVFDLIVHCMYEIDSDGGIADGYAYKSKKRIDLQRLLGYAKPVGPCEMYTAPVTESMVIGWFSCDPALKEGRKWWLPPYRCPNVQSDRTRYYEELMKNFNIFTSPFSKS